MLKDIIQRLAEDTGYNLEEDRAALVNLVNRGAEMMHKRLECNALMREVTVCVPENLIIALPTFVGPLRGLRESESDTNFKLNTQLAPRFIKDGWAFKWTNWRELRTSPIHTELNAVAPLTIEVNAVEATPITIKIVGQTNTAARVEEEVVMDAASKTTTESFGPEIVSIVCFDKNRLNDVMIKDDDDVEIAVLYNNENRTNYRLVDVSEYEWAKDVSDGTTTVEILYKVPFTKMLNDADQFPADGYDDTIYFQAMALWAAPQQGKENLATMYAQQAMIEPFSNKENEEKLQEKKMQFGRNPLYGAVRRRRYESYYNTRG